MKAKQIFWVNFLVILMFAAGAYAGSPLFSMYVGNYWNVNGSEPGYVWTGRDEITGTETVSGTPTFVDTETEDGFLYGRKWFSISPTEIKLWRQMIWDDDLGFITVTANSGLVFAKNIISTVSPNNHWTTTTTGTVSGSGVNCPVNLSLDVTVQAYETVTVPVGTYKAFKVYYVIHIYTSNCPGIGPVDEYLREYRWLVPYLGVIKWQNEFRTQTEVLSSMKIRKPIFDRDSDAKTDIALYRQSIGAWYFIKSSTNTFSWTGFGGDPSDIPVPGDYDGDGITDIALYRQSIGAWYFIKSSTNTFSWVGFGGDPSDIPLTTNPASYMYAMEP